MRKFLAVYRIQRPWHSSGNKTLVSHCGVLGSSPGDFTWDSRWTKWTGTVVLSFCSFPLLIIILSLLPKTCHSTVSKLQASPLTQHMTNYTARKLVMEGKGLFLCLQEPTDGHYLEPDKFISHSDLSRSTEQSWNNEITSLSMTMRSWQLSDHHRTATCCLQFTLCHQCAKCLYSAADTSMYSRCLFYLLLHAHVGSTYKVQWLS